VASQRGYPGLEGVFTHAGISKENSSLASNGQTKGQKGQGCLQLPSATVAAKPAGRKQVPSYQVIPKCCPPKPQILALLLGYTQPAYIGDVHGAESQPHGTFNLCKVMRHAHSFLSHQKLSCKTSLAKTGHKTSMSHKA